MAKVTSVFMFHLIRTNSPRILNTIRKLGLSFKSQVFLHIDSCVKGFKLYPRALSGLSWGGEDIMLVGIFVLEARENPVQNNSALFLYRESL